MLTLVVKMDGDTAWPDLKDKRKAVIFPDETKPIEVTILNKGMSSGRPSVAIRIDLADGRIVIAQISARLFCTAGRAFVAKYPDLFEGD